MLRAVHPLVLVPVSFLSVLASLFFGISPASAAGESPGPGYELGTRQDALTACNAPGYIGPDAGSAAGGWSSRSGVHLGFDGDLTGTYLPLARDIRPFMWRLEEPCYNSGAFGTGVRTQFAYDTYSLSNDQRAVWSSTGSAVTRLSAVGTMGLLRPTVPPALPGLEGSQDGFNNYMVCAPTEWSLPAEQTRYDMIAGGRRMSNTAVGGAWSSASAFSLTFRNGTLGCPTNHYIVRVVITICETGPNNIVTGAVEFLRCDTRVWVGDSNYWGFNEYDTGDGNDTICNPLVNPYTALSFDCQPWYTPPGETGPPIHTWCEGAPAAEWLSFEWLGPWIAHHAECLFNPRYGWDASGLINDALQDTDIPGLGEQVGSLVGAFDLPQSCGPLIPATSDVLPGFGLNTCSWTWAAPVRDILAAGVFILGGWYAFAFLAKTILSIVTRKTPEVVPE